MKKISVLFTMVLLFGLPLAAMSETTFVWNAEPNGETLTEDSVIERFRTSTNVTLVAEGTQVFYVAVSGHLSGNRAYGSSSEDAQLFWQGKESGSSDVGGVLPDATGSDLFTSWSSL